MKILLVCDAPNLPTGLGRIARDLASQIHSDPELRRRGVEVAQLGLYYDGSPWPWPVFPVHDSAQWGEGDIAQALEWWKADVIFTIWDPGRCFGILRGLQQAELFGKVRLWGYFAVDADNRQEKLGGPVVETLKAYERVLGYGRWGSGVLKRTVGRGVQYLPHGISEAFSPRAQAEPPAWHFPKSWEDGLPIIGVVATNQPRKDYGLVFEALAGLGCHLWIHIDNLITNAWAIPELAELTGRLDQERLTCTTYLRDEELAMAYARCDATIAPGLGEGFGYPIVESLACGTPVVHGDFAGGAELVPAKEWRFPPMGWRLEGPYALRRPVFFPPSVLEAARGAVAWKKLEPETCRAYCSGAVAQLGWGNLWPYWRSWIVQGMA